MTLPVCITMARHPVTVLFSDRRYTSHEGEFETMEIKHTTVFDGAISDHLAWLVSFENSLNGDATQPIDLQAVGDETGCNFGRWLYRNPEVLASAENFAQVEQLHHRFHAKAVEIASLFLAHANPDEIKPHLQQLEAITNQLTGLLFDLQEVHLKNKPFY